MATHLSVGGIRGEPRLFHALHVLESKELLVPSHACQRLGCLHDLLDGGLLGHCHAVRGGCRPAADSDEQGKLNYSAPMREGSFPRFQLGPGSMVTPSTTGRNRCGDAVPRMDYYNHMQGCKPCGGGWSVLCPLILELTCRQSGGWSPCELWRAQALQARGARWAAPAAETCPWEPAACSRRCPQTCYRCTACTRVLFNFTSE